MGTNHSPWLKPGTSRGGLVNDELEEWAKQDAREDGEFKDLQGSDQLSIQSKKTIQKAAHY
jgi:hypothetical protein